MSLTISFNMHGAGRSVPWLNLNVGRLSRVVQSGLRVADKVCKHVHDGGAKAWLNMASL